MASLFVINWTAKLSTKLWFYFILPPINIKCDRTPAHFVMGMKMVHRTYNPILNADYSTIVILHSLTNKVECSPIAFHAIFHEYGINPYTAPPISFFAIIMDRMITDGFTLWVPLPEVPKGVMPGNYSRKPTLEQQEAKYFRHAMDIRRLYPQMRYVCMKMLEHEQKLQHWEERINVGLECDNKPGPLNEPHLAVMCAKAQLESNRNVQKTLNFWYNQLLIILTEYVRKL